jgi:hypothetical protein
VPGMRVAVTVTLVLALCLAGCGGGSSKSSSEPKPYTAAAAPTPASGAAPWPAPPNPLARARAAGLAPERREQLQYHVHAHLDVFVNGRAVPVPAGIGINIADPGVQTGPDPTGSGNSYGGIKLCSKPCISPLHTHDATGLIHTESATVSPNRLGQLFTEWGVRLNGSCVGGYCAPKAPVAIFVDGKRFTGDPNAIGLADQREIAVVIGSPPGQIPRSVPPQG